MGQKISEYPEIMGSQLGGADCVFWVSFRYQKDHIYHECSRRISSNGTQVYQIEGYFPHRRFDPVRLSI